MAPDDLAVEHERRAQAAAELLRAAEASEHYAQSNFHHDRAREQRDWK